MKQASPELIALLANSDQFLMADLYTLTLIDGSVQRFCSLDIDITWNGNVFSSSALRIERGTTRTVVGVEVDTLEITAYPSASDLIAGRAFLAQVIAGRLDGAELMLERAFMPNWNDLSVGTVVLFVGRIADAVASRTKAVLNARSTLELLDVQMPRNLYQPGCLHTLYDSGCRLVKASYGESLATFNGSTRSLLLSGSPQPFGHYNQGTVTMTSGANSGISRTVKVFSAGGFTLLTPLPAVPSLFDSFMAYPGCDKSLGTCTAKFGNQANFRGFPFVPIPETAV